MVDQTTKEKGEGMHEESRELSLDDRMEGLNLQGEEEDLDFLAELDELVKDVRWLAVFRVHTTKPFSHASLFSAMRIACMGSSKGGVIFKVLGGNLFLVQMYCLGDWTMMEGRPWLFRGAAVVIGEYDGLSNVLA